MITQSKLFTFSFTHRQICDQYDLSSFGIAKSSNSLAFVSRFISIAMEVSSRNLLNYYCYQPLHTPDNHRNCTELKSLISKRTSQIHLFIYLDVGWKRQTTSNHIHLKYQEALFFLNSRFIYFQDSFTVLEIYLVCSGLFLIFRLFWNTICCSLIGTAFFVKYAVYNSLHTRTCVGWKMWPLACLQISL